MRFVIRLIEDEFEDTIVNFDFFFILQNKPPQLNIS
jgi:hypothetical protein